MDYKKIKNWQKLTELKRLKDLSSLPKELYFMGKWTSEIFQNCVAVVGSRKMTDYGRRVIEKIIPKLVFEKKTVVSGFMTGVDQSAHLNCVESGGKTIAVLGWGINYKLERADLILSKKIVDSGGLIISEWENQKPTLWTFPYRNRIVAALSGEIIVVEAAIKSGSLITARFAEKLKRKVWAVPGPITSKTSVGTNSLIATQKAQMWLDMPPETERITSEDPLVALIQNEPLTTNEISRNLKLSVSQVGAQLSLLELQGTIVEREGKFYLSNVG